jgi:hypothetical protein
MTNAFTFVLCAVALAISATVACAQNGPDAKAGSLTVGTSTITSGFVTGDTYAPLHCVIVLPRAMVPESGMHDPASRDYASVVWRDSSGQTLNGPAISLSSCVVEEPK